MKIMSPVDQAGAIEVNLQVIFGSPARSCAGNGVCKMLPQSFKVPHNWHCQAWPAELKYYQNGKLVLSCSLAQFTSKQIEQWFSNNHFLLEEEYYLPLWLCSRLGKAQLFLPPGIYNCTTGQFVTLTFSLEEFIETYPTPLIVKACGE